MKDLEADGSVGQVTKVERKGNGDKEMNGWVARVKASLFMVGKEVMWTGLQSFSCITNLVNWLLNDNDSN